MCEMRGRACVLNRCVVCTDEMKAALHRRPKRRQSPGSNEKFAPTSLETQHRDDPNAYFPPLCNVITSHLTKESRAVETCLSETSARLDSISKSEARKCRALVRFASAQMSLRMLPRVRILICLTEAPQTNQLFCCSPVSSAAGRSGRAIHHDEDQHLDSGGARHVGHRHEQFRGRQEDRGRGG